VPVVDGANRLVGIVTDRDIRSADIGEGGKGTSLIAEDIMTVDVLTIGPVTELLDAAQRLHTHQFGALPVVVGNKVVGMITRSDLLRCLIELLQKPVCEDTHHYVSPFAF
jgi:acetoin utilization protein AcuB